VRIFCSSAGIITCMKTRNLLNRILHGSIGSVGKRLAIFNSRTMTGLLSIGVATPAVIVTNMFSDVYVGKITAKSGPSTAPPTLRAAQSFKLCLQLVLHQNWEDAQQSKDDQ